MPRPGLVLDVDSSTPPILFHRGEGFSLEKLPAGRTRVIYPAEPLPGLKNVDDKIAAALENPLGDSKPLSELLFADMKLTICFDDISLPLPQMRKPDVRQRIIEAVLDTAAAAGVDDVEIIAALALHRRMTEDELRHAVGDRMQIMLEMHSLWSPHVVVEIADAVEEYDIYWIEDPIPMTGFSSLADLRSQVSMKVTASETLATRQQFRALMQAEAVDVVMLDIGWCGGLTEAKAIASMACAHGMLYIHLHNDPHNITAHVLDCAGLYEVGGDVFAYCLLNIVDGVPVDKVTTDGNELRIDNDGTPYPILTLS